MEAVMIPYFELDIEEQCRENLYRNIALINEATLSRKRNLNQHAVIASLFVWLGERLESWGSFLQIRFGSC